MQRFLTYLLTAALLCSLAGPSWAVEKKKASKKQSTKVEAKKKPAANKVANSAATQKPAKKRNYDSFVDKNKNGIDDRRERYRSVKKSVTPKKTVDANKAQKKTESKKD